MKQTKETPTFKDIMNSSLDTSIEESYANYGGTNTLGSVQSSSKNKYTPATVLKAPPLRHQNPDITMGQGDAETKSPAPFIYPFESIFTELVELYTRMEAIQRKMDGASGMASLSGAKQDMVKDSAEELIRIKSRLRKVIENIEEVTI